MFRKTLQIKIDFCGLSKTTNFILVIIVNIIIYIYTRLRLVGGLYSVRSYELIGVNVLVTIINIML